MNLKQLTDEVNSALDYNPDLEAYKDQVARVINRHYLQVSSQYNWLFRQKRVPMTLRKDITGDATKNKISVGNTDHSFDASNVIHFEGLEDTLPTREMLGNTLVINDNDTFTTRLGISHGASEREWTITGIWDTGTNTKDYGHIGRYGGTGSDEWPDGYQPSDASGVILDRPVIDPSTSSDHDATPSTPHTLTTKDYYTDWKIEFRQYYLPSDCIEVLGIVDRGLKLSVHTETQVGTSNSSTIGTSVNTAPDRGRIIFIDAAKEEHLYLDRDSAGDPVIGIEGMAVHLDAPMVPPTIEAVWTGDGDFTTDDTIRRNARLKGGDTYEYCYTFVYAGVESPPSPVTRVTLSDEHDNYFAIIGSQSVEGAFKRDGRWGPTGSGDPDLLDDLSSYDSLIGGSADDEADTVFRLTGRVKRFYRRKAFPDGQKTNNNGMFGGAERTDSGDFTMGRSQGYQRWLHIGDHFTDDPCIDIGRTQKTWTTPASTADFAEAFRSSMPVLGWPQAYFLEQGYWTYHDGELSKLKVLDEPGPHQTLRVYRPPSKDMDIEIRYLSRPKRLVADADAPEWPVQYHHLLVYMALADICLQHGMNTQSQLYERKSIELLDRMKQKYLSRTNRKYIRRGFDRVVFAGERFGIPTKV